MRAVHRTAKKRYRLVPPRQPKTSRLLGLTEQDLKNQGPRVTFSRSWKVGGLPDEIGSDGLDNIGKVVACGYQECSLFSIVGADFVDPTQDQGAGSKSDLTEPIHDLSTVDVTVEWHLA